MLEVQILKLQAQYVESVEEFRVQCNLYFSFVILLSQPL